MKNFLFKGISIILAIVILFSIFPLNVFAVTTKYETVKDNVPVWSEASSKSTQKYRIEYEGTIVEVTSSKTNSAGNLWYKLTDGNWVFSGNVKKHSHMGIMCGRATYSYAQKNASAHTVTTKMPDLCSCGHVMGYQTTTGDEAHSFDSNNTCTKCGYKKVHTHTAVMCGQATYSYSQKNATAHTVTTKLPDMCSCGYVMGYQTTTGDESHSFDSNNTCTKCGYKKVHTHKLDRLESAGSEYFTKDEYSHVFEEQLLELCSCGSALNKKLVRTIQRHEFDSSGKCVCGYTKETPTHTHKGTSHNGTLLPYR